MRVPPHPHIGLQTVTWLIEGTVLHRDSLGSEQLIRPGQLNLMTAGRGIAHSEESPHDHDPWLHGVQLWLALPDAHRQVAPDFEHHAELPAMRFGGLHAAVFVGSLASMPARVFSGVTGAEISAPADWRAAPCRWPRTTSTCCSPRSERLPRTRPPDPGRGSVFEFSLEAGGRRPHAPCQLSDIPSPFRPHQHCGRIPCRVFGSNA